MYSNDTSSSAVKVYPNTAAIKQMVLCGKNVQALPESTSENEKSEDTNKCEHSSEKECLDELQLILIILLLFTDFSGDAVFSVVMSLFFIA